jgi:hypothetical protein
LRIGSVSDGDDDGFLEEEEEERGKPKDQP